MSREKFKMLAMGICTGVSALLLAIAYLPGFYPEGQQRLQQNRLVLLVPVVVAVNILSAVGWLYLKSKENDHA